MVSISTAKVLKDTQVRHVPVETIFTIEGAKTRNG